MPATTITRAFLPEYLRYLQARSGHIISEAGMQHWLALQTDEMVREVLDAYYAEKKITPEHGAAYEANFLQAQPTAARKPTVSPTPLPRDVTKEPTKPVRSRKGLLTGGIVALLIVALGSIGYLRFQDWKALSQLPEVYAVTDNIALRTSPDSASLSKGGMFMFGQNYNGDACPSHVPLLESGESGGYYKVAVGLPQMGEYLLWGKGSLKEHTRYVHSSMVTTDEALFNRYRAYFAPLRQSFGDLDRLALKYRRLVDAAFLALPQTFNGLTVSTTCGDVASRTDGGQNGCSLFVKDADGQLTIYFLASNGKYFTVSSDKAYTTGSISAIEIGGWQSRRLRFKPGRYLNVVDCP